MKILVKTLFGLEEVLAEELREMGVVEMEMLTRAVQFEGDLKMLYRANYELRTAIRILVPFYKFRARDEHDLYDEIKKIDWSKHMKVTDTLAVDATIHSEYFNHSKYVALKTKDAIVDQFRDNTGRRPNVEIYYPTLQIQIHIYKDQGIVSFDSSGEALFKRGYRTERLDAPINEVLAAGMLKLAGWKGDRNFIDPMCGSGTIPIEAAMIAYNIPAQTFREKFGFETWKDFDQRLWAGVKQDAEKRKRDFDFQIFGFDKDFKAYRVAQHNRAAAKLDDAIIIKRQKFEKLVPPEGQGLMLINPPYDVRLQDEGIKDLYQMMGDQFKKQFAGWVAWIISPNMGALKSVGLRPSRKIPLFNGSLDCRFVKFEMYEGSRRKNRKEKSNEE